MVNILKAEKQIMIVSALAEGLSIRSIERMTGVHRDTVMRLGVRAGKAAIKFSRERLVGLDAERIEVDEIWGYVGKKQRHLGPDDDRRRVGDAWTFVAIDADSKLVPCFKVGKRDYLTALSFFSDLKRRLKNRVQLSTDQLAAYINAVTDSFKSEIDYAQVVKSFTDEKGNSADRRYSPGAVVSVEKFPMIGSPDLDCASTSYVERQNLTMRMHVRRLTRLTNAFSKKWENFEAAVGLHFWYYNFVKRHRTIKTVPAVAAGVTLQPLTVAHLVEQAA